MCNDYDYELSDTLTPQDTPRCECCCRSYGRFMRRALDWIQSSPDNVLESNSNSDIEDSRVADLFQKELKKITNKYLDQGVKKSIILY
jgi:hypothetical protein